MDHFTAGHGCISCILFLGASCHPWAAHLLVVERKGGNIMRNWNISLKPRKYQRDAIQYALSRQKVYVACLLVQVKPWWESYGFQVLIFRRDISSMDQLSLYIRTIVDGNEFRIGRLKMKNLRNRCK